MPPASGPVRQKLGDHPHEDRYNSDPPPRAGGQESAKEIKERAVVFEGRWDPMRLMHVKGEAERAARLDGWARWTRFTSAAAGQRS